MIRTIVDVTIGVLILIHDVFARILSLRFPYRLHLFEWCDLPVIPTFLKHCCQSTLTAQWTRRLPFLQSQPPSLHATHLLTQILSNITDSARTPYTIVDFCSGAGGPLPSIEKAVNATRLKSKLCPVLFRLSDLVPNLEAWIPLSAQSEYLSFIPQSVNALSPPPSTISVSARSQIPLPSTGHEFAYEEVSVTGKVHPDPRMEKQRQRDRQEMRAEMTADTKVIHLFCLSFHHFADKEARVVVKNMLRDSDAFCILELQERSLGCLAMMALEPVLLLAVCWWWFWGEWAYLWWTYGVPVLPFLHGWDGIVSCLRTRTFEEVRALVDGVIAEESRERAKELTLNGQSKGRTRGLGPDQWTISEAKVLHTWPAGYMHATVGIRKEIRKGMS
ncbi:hypothetical protein CAC42_4655 [Sphaceloma murrayae]|uniref:Uncharacterized protein n=1 Tax=Sphaceloma murrayae TaxID=2082308 RepID=A0A2K1QNV0_9PEZI|nr:hypothetical protein CAC42_4655 [Sphaceloma murrayae]